MPTVHRAGAYRLVSRRVRSVTLALGLATALAAGASCSAVLNWDPAGQPCNPVVSAGNTAFCAGGTSCELQSMHCVRDKSRGKGGACTQARQCHDGMVCPIDLLGGGGVAGTGGVQSCLAACLDSKIDGGFLQAEGCADQSEVCLPYLDAAAVSSNKALLGGCFPSAGCTAGGACPLSGGDSGSCIKMSTHNVTACLPGCEITWGTTQVYSDNCDASHSCVPVGTTGAQQFACLYNAQNSNATPLGGVVGQTPRAAGAPCSPVLAPCAKGYVCSQGSCAQYCQVTVNNTFPCPTGQSCCTFPGVQATQGPGSAGYCATACN